MVSGNAGQVTRWVPLFIDSMVIDLTFLKRIDLTYLTSIIKLARTSITSVYGYVKQYKHTFVAYVCNHIVNQIFIKFNLSSVQQ